MPPWYPQKGLGPFGYTSGYVIPLPKRCFSDFGFLRGRQNWDAFGFFDNIVGKGAAIYHTAGALGKGERIWILAKLPSYIQVIGDDITEKYLLLSNSHDGKASVQIKFTPIRVVCQNTLTMALREGPTLRVPHTKDLHKRLKQAEHLLGIIHSHYDNIEKIFKKMVRIKMNDKRSSEYFGMVFPDPRNLDDEVGHVRAKNQRLWAEYLAWNGQGNYMHGVTGTLWAAYNGVTELIDQCKSTQSRQTDDRRLNSLWFGDGYQIKARAFRIAHQKVQEWLN